MKIKESFNHYNKYDNEISKVTKVPLNDIFKLFNERKIICSYTLSSLLAFKLKIKF